MGNNRPTDSIKRNERDWAGQLISWIKSAIEKGTTIFQDATNDTSIIMESGRTNFLIFFYLQIKYQASFSTDGS
jgi:hypothetical protein